RRCLRARRPDRRGSPRTRTDPGAPVDRGRGGHRPGGGRRAARPGWFAPALGGAAVVLLPGAGSSRDAVVDHLAVLHEGGFAVLALDPRGHGRSTGRGMDWGWYGEADIAAAVTYLAGRA